ncbi:hypothetical protein Q5H91_06470 [Sphingomonas sp. KR1UV-12]|uniref:Glyoxalase/Bleomycin resistance-like N-terminal domain-containing protein n=1 Tax=Sphingomonas aurea TaxID=3063994 RepID=A0ABT9EIR1_9SPHN|nr:VOC family protein [Sphingomonas sp. KR1UV-12]MDP1026849.1 hypothetical protein [Sphingomonas sp. KR1UV-12]
MQRVDRQRSGLSEAVLLKGILSVARIDFIELPASDIDTTRAFYAVVFGWKLTDDGPSYSCTTTGNVE